MPDTREQVDRTVSQATTCERTAHLREPRKAELTLHFTDFREKTKNDQADVSQEHKPCNVLPLGGTIQLILHEIEPIALIPFAAHL